MLFQKKTDRPNTEPPVENRKHPFSIRSLENTTSVCLSETRNRLVPVYVYFGFLCATLTRDVLEGCFKQASNKAQQSSPPAFTLCRRREQNTEGLD